MTMSTPKTPRLTLTFSWDESKPSFLPRLAPKAQQPEALDVTATDEACKFDSSRSVLAVNSSKSIRARNNPDAMPMYQTPVGQAERRLSYRKLLEHVSVMTSQFSHGHSLDPQTPCFQSEDKTSCNYALDHTLAASQRVAMDNRIENHCHAHCSTLFHATDRGQMNMGIYDFLSNAPRLPSSPDLSNDDCQINHLPPCFSPIAAPDGRVSVPIFAHRNMLTPKEQEISDAMVAESWNVPPSPSNTESIDDETLPPPIPMMSTPDLLIRKTKDETLLKMRRVGPPPDFVF